MMTTPGEGPITAISFVTTIEDPHRFRRSQDVGAYLGLTPRRYQSGEVDINGRISKCGDRLTRKLLFEAANAILSRLSLPLALKEWGAAICRRSGFWNSRLQAVGHPPPHVDRGTSLRTESDRYGVTAPSSKLPPRQGVATAISRASS